jgi:predicted TIM-barrel fold metal-dependent hydrolase
MIIMEMSRFSDAQVIDCHAHLWMLRNHIDDESLRKQGEALIEVIRDPPLSQVYIFGRGGHPALYLKARYPGKFYAGGYAPWTGDALGFKVDWPSYVSSLIDLGYDGVGEMGSKPVTRDKHTPLDSTYYEGLWESCESEKFPVLCHVGDVEDFWHQELTPEWAKVRGWGYWKDDYPAMEELWTEIENVLTRHPKLRIVLCHFLFMSPHMERLEEFLHRHRNAHVDLTPGIELLYNISRRREDWRRFFIEHDDRILLGTDIGMSTKKSQHLARVWLLRKFIETGEEYYTPEEADDALTRYEEPFIGLSLPRSSVEKIYSGNFMRLWGNKPQPVNVHAAIAASEKQGDASVANALGRLD